MVLSIHIFIIFDMILLLKNPSKPEQWLIDLINLKVKSNEIFFVWNEIICRYSAVNC